MKRDYNFQKETLEIVVIRAAVNGGYHTCGRGVGSVCSPATFQCDGSASWPMACCPIRYLLLSSFTPAINNQLRLRYCQQSTNAMSRDMEHVKLSKGRINKEARTLSAGRNARATKTWTNQICRMWGSTISAIPGLNVMVNIRSLCSIKASQFIEM